MAFYTGSLFLDLLGLLTAFAAVVYAYFKWTFQYWDRRGVPYLEPSFPWGNVESSYGRTRSPGDHMGELYRQVKEKGWKHCGLFLVAKPTWFIVDLELVKNVMTKEFHHFVDRGSYTNEKDDPLSAHLFAIGGKKWRNLRTKLTPTFTSGKMRGMFQTVIDCGLVLERYIEDHITNKEAANIKNILASFSTDVIGSCAFGLECNSFKDSDNLFRKHMSAVFVGSVLRSMKMQFANNFPSTARAIGIRFVPKDASDFFMKVVEDTVTYRQKENIVRKDVLQLLIDIKNNNPAEKNEYKGDGTSLTMNEIAAQSFVFFIAGFETSSTTMTFALYELATHQDLQEKVREEINTVLAKHDNQITYDSLSELKYMRQVIDETLRMYPPVPFVTRVCTEEYKVPDDDVTIEKGTRVVIPIKGIHYDKEYYKNPTVFDPERFNAQNKEKLPNYAHIPFGEGPRICIGERFGIMQTKVGLTCLLRNFRVKLNEKTQVPLKMAVKSFFPIAQGDIWLNIEKL